MNKEQIYSERCKECILAKLMTISGRVVANQCGCIYEMTILENEDPDEISIPIQLPLNF